MDKPNKIALIVKLNGTNENPWHRMNLTQNPFPQIPRAELMAAMTQLASLDGDPLTGPDDIRSRLTGWSDEFIELCVAKFKPGELVEFSITFPDVR
jgi:hypothetical protein